MGLARKPLQLRLDFLERTVLGQVAGVDENVARCGSGRGSTR